MNLQDLIHVSEIDGDATEGCIHASFKGSKGSKRAASLPLLSIV
jgi:hypothetical protein